MYTPPRGLVPGRAPEIIESLKAEFESLAHEANLYKMQRDDYERKLQAQLGELNNIQQTLYDLERNHSKIKQQYEDEIIRLRRQLEGPSSFNSVPTSIAPPLSMQMPAVVVGTNTGSTNNPSSLNVVNNQPRGGPAPPTPTGPGGNPEKGNIGGVMNNSGGPPGGPMGFYPSAALPPVQDNKRGGFQPPVSAPAPPLPNAAAPPKRPREDQYYAAQQQQQQPGGGFVGMNPIAENNNAGPKQLKAESPDMNEDKYSNKNAVDSRRSESSGGVKEEGSKKSSEEGADWIVGYNPGVQTNLNIDLMHNLEHSSVVCCVRFSNDGKHLATGCNKSAQIYDVETGEKVYTFAEDLNKEGDLYIRSVCFSPDNRYLAAGAEDKTVKVWDVENKRLHHTFMGHELDIYSLDFSKDGNLIVSGSGDKKAKIWDLEKGECLFTLGNEEVGPKDGVTSVAFSPDGRLVAAGSLDRIVRLWDAQTGYFLERYEGHLDSVYSVAFSPDGRTLASGSLDKTLKLWDLSGARSRSRCRSTFTGHKDFVLSVAFSPDGNWLISGSKDRSVQFWDPRSAITHMMLQGHKNSVISVAVSPTGRHFATGSGDFRARAWRFYSNPV